MKFLKLHLALLLASATCCLTPEAAAQTALAEITGDVTDPAGSAIPGVKITLTNTATGLKTALTANEVGAYYGRSILPGTYDVIAEAQGFKTLSLTANEIRTGQVFRFDVKMEVGSVSERIEVSGQAGAVELQKDSGDASTNLNQQTVIEMPKITRRTLELVAITPAVTITDKGGVLTINTPFFSTAGNPGVRASMFYTDGTSTTFARAQGDGGGMAGLNPPPEVVSEMRVVYNNYSAEFGEGMGAVILSTTKSGTNQLRGSAYYYGQNDALDSTNFFATTKNPNKYHNFGAAVGGPIIRNKTFFFANLERTRWVQITPFVLTIPSIAQKTGDFSQTFDGAGRLIPIYDPATARTDASGNIRDQFPGNRIPATRFDPIMSRILNNYVADPNSVGLITGGNNYRAPARTRDMTALWQFYRVDHQLTENNRFYFRFTRDAIDPPFFGPFKGTKGEVADPYEESYTSFGNTAGASWTRLILNRTISDFRMGYTNFAVDRKAMGDNNQVWQQNWPAKLGLKNLGPDTFPHFDLAGYGPYGGGTWVQELVYDSMRSWSFYETLSHQRGTHNFRVGGGWKHSKAVYASRFWPSGSASFDTRATALPGVGGTGNSVASALLGQVATARVQESPAPDMRYLVCHCFYPGRHPDRP